MGARKTVSAEGRIIAENLRLIREREGLSQSEVATFLNVSYQQVQKYEAGVNRIPLQILPVLCDLFGVPVESFFTGLGRGASPVDDHEVQTLQRSFARIDNAPMRRKILQVVDILAS